MIVYNVDKEKRTVVAMYEKGEADVIDSIDRMLDKIGSGDSIVNIFVTWHKLCAKYKNDGKFKLVGIAKCHEDDEWDETKGKEIAKTRLNRKFINLKNEILRICIKALENGFKKTMVTALKKYDRAFDYYVNVSYDVESYDVEI